VGEGYGKVFFIDLRGQYMTIEIADVLFCIQMLLGFGDF
jgi:hypothetical protein